MSGVIVGYQSPVANRDCNGCGAKPGERHRPLGGGAGWCDLARCVQTGQQLWVCEGEIFTRKGRTYGIHEGVCGPDVWDGEYPGTKLCRELGLYTAPDSIWGLTEDLNELIRHSTWDKDKETYVYHGTRAQYPGVDLAACEREGEHQITTRHTLSECPVNPQR